jgi:hypothetical protein
MVDVQLKKHKLSKIADQPYRLQWRQKISVASRSKGSTGGYTLSPIEQARYAYFGNFLKQVHVL